MSKRDTPPTEAAPRPVPVLGLRPREAATAIGISERKLHELTADRDSGIPVVRLGGCVLYPAAELSSWLAEQARTQARGRR